VEALWGQAIFGPWVFFYNLWKCNQRHHHAVSGITFL
jgi:hypothetical protein